jgi:curli biogenesis system outer membrane secretion channel CsgG
MRNGKVSKCSAPLIALLFCLSGCATPRSIQEVTPESQIDNFKVDYKVPPGLKYRVSIAKFEDKTGYGSNLFGVIDDLGKQAADILASHLVKSGRVILVERQELEAVKAENALQNKEMPKSVVWSNALILGAVTEFGTKTDYQRAVFEAKKMQTAEAKVTIRMVDPETSVAFYSEFGHAAATKEATMKLGYGGASDYDATLSDKALNGAIVKLVNNILNTLINRPWEARIIDIQADKVFINAGERTGLKVGNKLDVVQPGKKVKNPASNATIQLPGTVVGMLEVESLFGTSEVDEGSVCKIVSGEKPTLEHIVRIHEG